MVDEGFPSQRRPAMGTSDFFLVCPQTYASLLFPEWESESVEKWKFSDFSPSWKSVVRIAQRREGPQGRAIVGPKLILTAGGRGQGLMGVTCRKEGERR